MQIFVKTPNGESVPYKVEPYDSVERFRAVISDKIKEPVINIILFFAGKQLEEGNIIQDYEIIENSTIYMALKKEV